MIEEGPQDGRGTKPSRAVRYGGDVADRRHGKAGRRCGEVGFGGPALWLDCGAVAVASTVDEVGDERRVAARRVMDESGHRWVVALLGRLVLLVALLCRLLLLVGWFIAR